MNTQTPERKRLAEGSQNALYKKIEQWRTKGWRLCMTQICYCVKNRKTYIAELIKE